LFHFFTIKASVKVKGTLMHPDLPKNEAMDGSKDKKAFQRYKLGEE
jgi:hypothetical protein